MDANIAAWGYNHKAPNNSTHDTVIATKEIRIHLQQVPTCLKSNDLITEENLICALPFYPDPRTRPIV